MANVQPIGLMGFKAMDKMETNLLSNQKTTSSSPEVFMQYQSCPLDPFFRSMVKALRS
jgi:hypothetical protein